MNSPEIIPDIFYFPNISKYSNSIIFLSFSFSPYDYKIQNSSIKTHISVILVSKILVKLFPIQPCHPLSMVHILENSKNTLVPYSACNFPVRTESNDSFATILINSELYRTKPHVPSYKYTQLQSPSPHPQHPEPR